MPGHPQTQATDLPTAERTTGNQTEHGPLEEWAPGQGDLVCSPVPCCVSHSRLGTLSENLLLIIAMSCQSWHIAKETKTQRGAG